MLHKLLKIWYNKKITYKADEFFYDSTFDDYNTVEAKLIEKRAIAEEKLKKLAIFKFINGIRWSNVFSSTTVLSAIIFAAISGTSIDKIYAAILIPLSVFSSIMGICIIVYKYDPKSFE